MAKLVMGKGKKKAKKSSKKKAAKKKTSKKKGRGRAGYPEAEKKAILARWLKLRNQGQTAQDAAKEVGVTYITLNKWAKESGKAPKAQGRKAKAKSKTVSRKARKTRKTARKATGGTYTLSIEGQGTKIQQDIDADTMAQIVKLIF